MNQLARGSRARVRAVLMWLVFVVLLFAIGFQLNRMKTPPPPPEPDRVASARKRCEPELRALFQKAGLSWPVHEIFLRGIKREAQLELWARSGSTGPFRLVKTYAFAAQSGGPGPKRLEGDLQVPEGFYEVDRFNPESAFHLSLGLNYPNASDQILSDPLAPGFDIFIHGGDASIGCVALGDPAIEEVYLAALESRARPIHVHLFPARMDASDWPAWRDEQLADRPEIRWLWEQLAAGWSLFERERCVPRWDLEPDGGYHCRSGR